MSCEAPTVAVVESDNEAQTEASTILPPDGGSVVSVDGLSKCYRLWDSPQGRLKQPLRSMLARWLPIEPRQYFREFWALRDISLDVAIGETVGIIGRNGSGKSTLLQILCGTLAPTCGTVHTEGRISALLELGSGFNPECTGKENVYMNASILGLSTDEIDEKYETIVEFADIGEFIDQPVKLYSSGMYVRLAFAVAVNVDADILIVDEALAVGDAFFVQKCMRVMREFQERGTLLFVSHDTGAVTNLCDRAILLENGSITAQGSAKEVSEKYQESLYAAHQDVAAVRETDGSEGVDQPRTTADNSSGSPDSFSLDYTSASFGTGAAIILEVSLLDAQTRRRLDRVAGGERVLLLITALPKTDLESPIVGFNVKDRIGQFLFGDNTYLTYREKSFRVKAGAPFSASFTFSMPP
jgi:lipopolysaccharide transport system ATP-binding protein